jgi:DNA-binding ferritin-like protein
VSRDEQLGALADEIDAIAERLADRSIELLRAAIGDAGDSTAAATEKVVTRARRALEKASSLLREFIDALNAF